VSNFAGAVLAALAAVVPLATIADSSSDTQRYYEVRGAKLYTQIQADSGPTAH
jgi:hypothetical protein